MRRTISNVLKRQRAFLVVAFYFGPPHLNKKMMKRVCEVMNFGNVITAMVTPFDQNGEIDFERTRGLVNYLINNGSDSLVVAGTTGESPTISYDEKVQLFKVVLETADGRVPVIAGTGSNNTKASIELTKEAEAIGVDAVMLVTPYYNKPSQEGMYQHFKAIADSTALPVMLYNIPGRSVVNMLPETIVRLSQINNIISVKEASGDLDAFAEIIRNTSEDFSVYSGDDSLTLPTLAIGGSGIISVSAHIIGNEMQEMVEHFLNGEVKEAAAIHRHLLPIMKELFKAPNPTSVKEVLNRIGVPVGSVRLPLIPLNETERLSLHNLLAVYETKEASGY